MKRFFFHIRDGAVIDDHVGTECAGWREARMEAFNRAGSTLRAYPDHWSGTPWQMHVVDEAGTTVLKIGFQVKEAETGTLSDERMPG